MSVLPSSIAKLLTTPKKTGNTLQDEDTQASFEISLLIVALSFSKGKTDIRICLSSVVLERPELEIVNNTNTNSVVLERHYQIQNDWHRVSHSFFF